MARNFTKIWSKTWDNPDFLNLTPQAQHLYLYLSTASSTSYAGVSDWRPGRIMQRAREWSLRDIYLAAQELSDAFMIVVDQESEEVLIRSFIRHDESLRHPQLSVSVARAVKDVFSGKIRAVLSYELRRLRKENPEWVGWTKKELLEVVQREAVAASELDTLLTLPDGVSWVVDN